MTGDRRWSGGAANRGWNTGTRAVPAVNYGALALAVVGYLEDCARFRALLDPAHHPTAGGALRVIYHRNAEEKAAILAYFRRAMGIKRSGIAPLGSKEMVSLLYTPEGGAAL